MKFALFFLAALSYGQITQSMSSGGGSGATTPNTVLPLCGNGAANSTKACVSGTDYQPPLVQSVKSYGAVGNGTTDDHTAIQNCIAAVSTTGGECHLPPATGYSLGTTGLTITAANVALVADGGKGASPLLYAGTGDAISVGAYTSVQSNNRLQNLTVRLSNSATGVTGIHLKRTQDIALLNNSVETVNNGAQYINGQTCFWLDGGNTGTTSDFGSSLSALGNDCRLGSTWIGIRITPSDMTYANAFTHVDWIGGRLVSGTTAHTSTPQTVCGATNASPIVLTLCAAAPTYAYATSADIGKRAPVIVASVGGNTNANGYWVGSFTDATHVQLRASSGNGSWTSGGTLALSSTGVFIETGSEIRLTADVEQWNQGVNTDANYVGCMSPRFELNDIDWVNGLWDRSCLITPHASYTNSVVDRGTNTTRITGDVTRLPNTQTTNGLYVTGDTGGSNAAISMGQYANGTADAYIDYLGSNLLGVRGAWHITPIASDPPCTVTANRGNITLNSSGGSDVFKVCMNISGTVQWVTK
jgi:hypothetical protein